MTQIGRCPLQKATTGSAASTPPKRCCESQFANVYSNSFDQHIQCIEIFDHQQKHFNLIQSMALLPLGFARAHSALTVWKVWRIKGNGCLVRWQPAAKTSRKPKSFHWKLLYLCIFICLPWRCFVFTSPQNSLYRHINTVELHLKIQSTGNCH